MPIAFSKDARATIYLQDDLKRPEAERVGFLCRFITERERQRALELMEQSAAEKKDADKSKAIMEQALAVGLIGPKDAKLPDGQEVPCSLAGIPMVLTLAEMFTLGWEYPNAITLSEVDLKKSMLPSSPDGEAHAKENPPANAGSVPPPTSDSARAA